MKKKSATLYFGTYFIQASAALLLGWWPTKPLTATNGTEGNFLPVPFTNCQESKLKIDFTSLGARLQNLRALY